MINDKRIVIRYRTEQGNEYPSYVEAVLADVLETSTLYVESYKIKEIVSLIAKHFHVKEKKNEIIDANAGSESTEA